MRKKWIYISLFALFAAVFIYAGWNLLGEQREYLAGEEAYSGLEDYIDIPVQMSSASNPDEELSQTDPEQETPEEDSTVWPVVNFDALREVNPDIVGWIYLEDTNINYPVVQGEDNDYYLKHLFEGDWNSAGCIFLDSRNEADFSNRHSIIYGHHMKNDTMFSDLDHYKKQEFYDSHPTILLMTPEKNYKIEVFAGYVASVDDDAWKLGFTIAGYEDWLSQTKEKSCFSSPVTPVTTDQVVTLSTCSYEFNNARFVVAGVLG